MKAVVIGLGEFGYAAAIALARAGVETIAMDREMGPVERVKDHVDLAVRADCTTPESLEANWVSEADVLVAGIGEDFEAQVLVVVQAKQVGVKLILARATSTIHQRVLEAVGAHVVINPEREAAEEIVLRILAMDPGTERIAAGLCVFQWPASPGMEGRTLEDQGLDLLGRFGVQVLGLRRASDPASEVLLSRDTRIETGDTLFCAGNEGSVVRLRTEYGQR